jgi:3-hydroxyacyl-[acyl-carrier-protein] dehydratase
MRLSAITPRFIIPSCAAGVCAISLAEPEMPLEVQTMNIGQIMEYLPHRYPFLLIDRVVEIEPAKRIVAIKNVTINEPFFNGHFPGYPIMPGVLVVEAMAQTGCILLLSEIPDREKKLVVFTGIDGAKFRRAITPGDQIRIEVDVLSFRPRAGKMEGKAYIDGKLACEATLTCAVVPRPGSSSSPAGKTPKAAAEASAETQTEAQVEPVSAQ